MSARCYCPDCGAVHDVGQRHHRIRITTGTRGREGGCNFCNDEPPGEVLIGQVLILQAPGPGAALQARLCPSCAATLEPALRAFLR